MFQDLRLRQLKLELHPSPTWVDALCIIGGVVAALMFLAVTQ
jgi:hypothetical protein